MNNMYYRSFGINAKLKHPMKLFAHLYFSTAMEVLVAGIVILWGGDLFSYDKSVWPEVGYYISSILLAVYLLCPTTLSNPGKKNFDLIFLSFTPTVRFFQSIDPPTHKQQICCLLSNHMKEHFQVFNNKFSK